ncbi:MAG: DUF1559 domain-containing protein, partial [Planctomycetales bacterium]|nr:DUF1559 domain-containing protein [Planctomycetales bacterium]
DQGWAESLHSWGWWGACGGRKSIGHVTLASEAPLNYRVEYSYSDAADLPAPFRSAAEFQSIVNRRLSSFGSGHSAGANFAYADASVRYVSNGIVADILRAMCTRNGSESATALDP